MHLPSLSAVREMTAYDHETSAGSRLRPQSVLIATPRSEIRALLESGAATLHADAPETLEIVDGGAAALAALEGVSFDGLILDGELDDITAMTVLQRGRARCPDARAVLFTERHDAMLERSMVRVGFTACVPLADAFKVGFLSRALAAMTVGGERRRRGTDEGGQLTAMFLAMREPALLVDYFGRIRLGNRAFAAAASLGRVSPVGRDLAEFLPEVETHDLASRLTDEPAPLRLRRASGNIDVVTPRFVPLEDRGESLIGVLF